MPVHVLLLRGINVSGRNRVPMADLRALVTALGFDDVATYVQSGNVIFASADGPAVVSARAESALELELGLRLRILGRTHVELGRIVDEDPYPGAEPTHHHVVFLSGPANPKGLAAIAAAAADGEAFVASDHEIHLLLPNGIGRSRIVAALTERALGVLPTTRNWRTVCRLHELSRPRP